jgi:hypothetical protein
MFCFRKTNPNSITRKSTKFKAPTQGEVLNLVNATSQMWNTLGPGVIALNDRLILLDALNEFK